MSKSETLNKNQHNCPEVVCEQRKGWNQNPGGGEQKGGQLGYQRPAGQQPRWKQEGGRKPGLGRLPQGTWASPEQVGASCSHLACGMEGGASGSCSFLYPRGASNLGWTRKAGGGTGGRALPLRLAGAFGGPSPHWPDGCCSSEVGVSERGGAGAP